MRSGGTHEFAFEADADQHLELISGTRGSGKSTLIEAIILCFYGETYRDNLHSAVNRKVVDELDVDERATAEISVELIDTREAEKIRITREVSTIKTPQGRTNIIEDPVVQRHSSDGKWHTVQDSEYFIAELIPTETQPFSFYDPESILELEPWEVGELFEEFLNNMQELQNRAAHAQPMPDSSANDIDAKYLQSVNQHLSIINNKEEVDRAEEYLDIGSQKDNGSLLSRESHILISFALTLAASELEGVEAPLVMEAPFTRGDEETFETMSQMLQQASGRQTIIVGSQHRIDEIANDLADVVASHHWLSFEDTGSIRVERV